MLFFLSLDPFSQYVTPHSSYIYVSYIYIDRFELLIILMIFEQGLLVHPKTPVEDQDELSSLLQVLIRRHTPFSPYVAPCFPHMSEIHSLFFRRCCSSLASRGPSIVEVTLSEQAWW